MATHLPDPVELKGAILRHEHLPYEEPFEPMRDMFKLFAGSDRGEVQAVTEDARGQQLATSLFMFSVCVCVDLGCQTQALLGARTTCVCFFFNVAWREELAR